MLQFWLQKRQKIRAKFLCSKWYRSAPILAPKKANLIFFYSGIHNFQIWANDSASLHRLIIRFDDHVKEVFSDHNSYKCITSKVILVTAPSDLQPHCIAAFGVSPIKFNLIWIPSFFFFYTVYPAFLVGQWGEVVTIYSVIIAPITITHLSNHSWFFCLMYIK